MQTTITEEVSSLLWDSIKKLSPLEAAYFAECHLSERRESLKAFAAEHNLGPTAMADLRIRAMAHLRGKLAENNIHSLTDIL